jgi:PTS system nitrogen regulatory IIA component
VQIIAMIVAGEGQHAEYIRMLAKIVAVLKREPARNALLAAGSAREVYDVLSAES